MKKCEIWSEGYSVTDERGHAQLMGESEGNSFRNACDNLARTSKSFADYYDSEHLTYWGM